jgi:hypothetical protein
MGCSAIGWMGGYNHCLFGVIKNSICRTLYCIIFNEDNGECYRTDADIIQWGVLESM